MSGVLRPWLLDLAKQGMFNPIWSDRIGKEWRRNAARLWDIEPSMLQDEWDKMQTQFVSANVSRWPTNTPLPALKYSDAKDWHVIETGWLAKQANPDATVGVLTINIKDFSRSELRQLGLDLWEPDRLLSKWWPDHQTVLTHSLNQTIDELIATGRRHPAPITDFLKRDRLFRLNKLMATTDGASITNA